MSYTAIVNAFSSDPSEWDLASFWLDVLGGES